MSSPESSSEQREIKTPLRSAFIVRSLSQREGAGGSVLALAQEMAGMGHNISVITTADHTNGAAGTVDIVTSNSELKLPHRLQKEIDIRSFLQRLRAASGILHFLLWQNNEIQKGHFDITNAATPITLGADVLTPRSSVWQEFLPEKNSLSAEEARRFTQTTYLKNPLFWQLGLLELWNMRVAHNYKKVIAISNLHRNQLCEIFHIPLDDVAIVYNGTDSQRFHPRNREVLGAQFRNQYGIRKDEIVICFVGVNFYRKGLDVAIRAFADPSVREKPWRLIVAGKDRPDAFLRLANILGIGNKIIFTGFREDIENIYAASDFSIFPTRVDPFGKVVPEAMAAGIPVIMSANAGSSELVTNEYSGLVIPNSDPASYAKAIELFIQYPQARFWMGENARKAIEPYTWRRSALQTLEVYREVLQMI